MHTCIYTDYAVIVGHTFHSSLYYNCTPPCNVYNVRLDAAAQATYSIYMLADVKMHVVS